MSLPALTGILLKHATEFHPVVPFNAKTDKLLKLDFTEANTELTANILENTPVFSAYIAQKLGEHYLYGIGGYAEHRTIYSRSSVFDALDEPRRLHLGIDIWGSAGTPVSAPLGGYVHSFAFNNNFGDYGATIILHHQMDGMSFNTLYGHLSLKDIAGLQEGHYISRGAVFAHFGVPEENGYWPPHLHFQVIGDMYHYSGDYPGVCQFSRKEAFLENSPDPDIFLQMMRFART